MIPATYSTARGERRVRPDTDALRAARRARGLTNAQLAERAAVRLGASPVQLATNLRRLESGHRPTLPAEVWAAVRAELSDVPVLSDIDATMT